MSCGWYFFLSIRAPLCNSPPPSDKLATMNADARAMQGRQDTEGPPPVETRSGNMYIEGDRGAGEDRAGSGAAWYEGLRTGAQLRYAIESIEDQADCALYMAISACSFCSSASSSSSSTVGLFLPLTRESWSVPLHPSSVMMQAYFLRSLLPVELALCLSLASSRLAPLARARQDPRPTPLRQSARRPAGRLRWRCQSRLPAPFVR